MSENSENLNRVLSLPVVTFYGVGTIVGAGIYVLVGKVAGIAGHGIAYAFFAAGLVATFTAFSYCELVSRFPRAAGEALYVEKGFGMPLLSRLVGWMVVLTGIVSAATIANGFTGYFAVFWSLPPPFVISVLVLGLGAIAAWGVKQSAAFVNAITLLSLVGLMFVIYAGLQTPNPQSLSSTIAFPSWGALPGVMLGAFLAFYAFIGFEDMVNLVEEVKQPRQTLPKAILLAIGISLLFYVGVALVAARAAPLDLLAESDAPLALVVQQTGFSTGPIAFISLVAVVNGALVQLVMASRVIYGMARQGLAAHWLGNTHAKTKTPLTATIVVTAAILVFALWLPLTVLAQITSMIVLLVFVLVNVALISVKRRGPGPVESFSVSALVPAMGALTSSLLILVQILA